MSVSIGIVGLPNVGKSTLFNAILKKQVAFAANYPFATIDPNVGVVEVPDERVDVLSKISKSEKNVYSTLKIYDIAGLVKGASKGEGLGNQFLGHIREVDLIVMLLRGFEDESVVRAGSVNPDEDRGVLEMELCLKDLEMFNYQLSMINKLSNSQLSKEEIKTLLENVVSLLNEGKLLNSIAWKEKEMEFLKQYNPLTLKPIIYVENVGEGDLVQAEQINKVILNSFQNPMLKQVQHDECFSISAKLEFELASLSKEDQELYLKELGLSHSPLEDVVKIAFAKLNLKTFLTTGPKESRAWKFNEGQTARDCAGIIHTDFYNNFIAADVISYDKFIEAGSFEKAKEKGWVRLEGKEYVMKDGDVVVFRVGRGHRA